MLSFARLARNSALFVLVCASVVAAGNRPRDPDLRALHTESTQNHRSAASTGYATGFENPPFQPGSILNQGGWQANAAGVIGVLVTPFNPDTGEQHMRMLDNGSNGATSLALSPRFDPLDEAIVSFRYAISNSTPGPNGGANYEFAPQSTTDDLIAARVAFDFGGFIFVIDDLGGGPAFVPTNTKWFADGQYHSFAIEFSKAADRLRYFQDGQLIYTSAGGLFGADDIDQLAILHDNFQLPDETADVDNLLIVPEPAAIVVAFLLPLGRQRNAQSRAILPMR